MRLGLTVRVSVFQRQLRTCTCIWIRNNHTTKLNQHGVWFLAGLQFGCYHGLIITDLAIAKEVFIDKADVFSDRVNHTDHSRLFGKPEDKGLFLYYNVHDVSY